MTRPVLLVRKPNWASELTRFLVELQKLSRKGQLKFDWDNANCGWFVSKAIERMTGTNPYEPFEDAESAFAVARKLKDLGFGSTEEYSDSWAQSVPLVEAQRGDVGLADGISNEGLVLALLDPPFFWVIGPEGLMHLPLYPTEHSANVGIVKAYKIGV